MNRKPVVKTLKTPHPRPINVRPPKLATSVRMNAKCTKCDAANASMKRPLLFFNQLVARLGQSWSSELERKVHRKKRNEIRAVARIPTRISISSIEISYNGACARCRKLSSGVLTSFCLPVATSRYQEPTGICPD